MSDTTITPEERALWFKDAQPKSVGHYEPIDFEMDKRIRRLLTALEAAEARAEKAEKELAGADAEISSLQDQLTDCECADNEAHHTLCEIARLVDVYDQCQELGDDIVSATIEAVQTLIAEKQQTEAESARLRAERDWLAGSLAEDGCPYLAFWADFEGDMRPDWCICTDTADDGFDCTGDPKECWQQEAARRAVAAGEGE